VRYLARYYPIFVLLVLMALERLASSENPVARPALVVSAACLALSLVENSLRFAAGLAQLPETAIYWFPD
jgi:branched-subunit amino acid transport protein AzlD